MAGAAKRRVGIIGGMGPEATVLLMSRIVALTPAEDDSDHVPLLVDSNTQVPSRIAALIEKTGADPAPVLVEMARRLEVGGAEALAMPCNTAHHYAPAIRRAVGIPFLDMVELSVRRACAMPLPNRRIGLLASPAVRLTGIFDRAFAEAGCETLYPDDEAPVLAAIRAIKRDSADPAARTAVAAAASQLAAAGSDLILIACSELSLIADAVVPTTPVIDTIDVLAEAVVAFASSDRTTSSNDGRATSGQRPLAAATADSRERRPDDAAKLETTGQENRETAR